MKQFRKWVAAAVLTALVFTTVILPAGEALAYVLPDENLSYGMSGEAVLSLQQALKEQGYLEATPDGIFGNLTREALLSFQRDAGIGADAIAGPITLSILYGINVEEVRNYFSGTGSDTGNPVSDNTENSNTGNPGNTQSSSGDTGTASRNLSRGMTGDDVKALQEKLKTLEYLSATPDGIFGNYTYQAVVAFQKDHKIGQDGVAGPITMAAMDKAIASGETVSQEPETPAQPQVPADVESSFTGFRTVGNETWYFINGHVDTSKTCLVRASFDGSSGWWYVREGKVLSFINPPTLTGISNAPGGVEVNWEVQEGVQAYRVYWLNSAGEWKFLADTTDNYYIDTDVESGNRYSYTVRAISKDGKVNLSDYDDNGISFTYTYNYDRYNASVTGAVTKAMVVKEAKAQGFDNNEIIAIVSWVEGEAYHLLGESYLAYLSACVLINGINDNYYGRGSAVLKKIATWGSYYTVAKQKERYKNASAEALRAVYIALKHPTTGIHHCRGAYIKPSNCFYDSNLFIQGQDIYVW